MQNGPSTTILAASTTTHHRQTSSLTTLISINHDMKSPDPLHPNARRINHHARSSALQKPHDVALTRRHALATQVLLRSARQADNAMKKKKMSPGGSVIPGTRETQQKIVPRRYYLPVTTRHLRMGVLVASRSASRRGSPCISSRSTFVRSRSTTFTLLRVSSQMGMKRREERTTSDARFYGRPALRSFPQTRSRPQPNRKSEASPRTARAKKARA